jgi:hypothetical protein
MYQTGAWVGGAEERGRESILYRYSWTFYCTRPPLTGIVEIPPLSSPPSPTPPPAHTYIVHVEINSYLKGTIYIFPVQKMTIVWGD